MASDKYKSIKVVRTLPTSYKENRANLFHYAHFICDCLFPEIVENTFKFKEVFREKSLTQTLGNFSKIYTEVMLTKHTELPTSDFNNLNIDTIEFSRTPKMNHNKINYDKFRQIIFKRYNINHLEYNNEYPEVILVKRGDRKNLIDDKYLSKINKNVKNGKERREINNISDIENFLDRKYKNKFKSLYFEDLPFEEQVKYFNNAKLIICAHGAVMSNMFFCKEGTKIIEVTCGKKFGFFNTISNMLNLNHIQWHENIADEVIRVIQSSSISGINLENKL